MRIRASAIYLLTTLSIEAYPLISEAAPPASAPSAAEARPERSVAPGTRSFESIVLELTHLPDAPVSSEAKAQEMARLVARSTSKEAEYILNRLIPEALFDGIEGVESPSSERIRRAIAAVLKKVALDKDDNRAALAISSLGEWAKIRRHGEAAQQALDQLAEERTILLRPKRFRAIERVQARLEISNVGE